VPSIEELKENHNRAANVRKGLHALLFIGDSDAALVDTLTDGSGLVVPPETYRAAGLISTDGVTIGRETETEDVLALGYGSPVRRDTTSATQTAGATLLETNAVTRELTDGVVLAGITADTNGEVSWDHPDIPPPLEYRVLIVFGDGAPGSYVYTADFYPRAVVSEVSEVTNAASDPTQYEVTFTGLLDDAAGFARRSFMGGEGFDAAAAGFTANAG